MSTPKKGTTIATTSAVLEAYAQVIQEARAEFEAEKAQQLADWKTELARKKEADLYEFNKEKRDREDELELELKDRVASVEGREAKVKEREVAVGDAEKTIATLNSKLEEIPAIAAKAESTGYNKGKADAAKEADATAKILAAQTDAKVSVLENKIETLEASVETHLETIASLREELKAANARVQDIATASVNASGQSKVTVNTTQQK